MSGLGGGTAWLGPRPIGLTRIDYELVGPPGAQCLVEAWARCDPYGLDDRLAELPSPVGHGLLRHYVVAAALEACIDDSVACNWLDAHAVFFSPTGEWRDFREDDGPYLHSFHFRNALLGILAPDRRFQLAVIGQMVSYFNHDPSGSLAMYATLAERGDPGVPQCRTFLIEPMARVTQFSEGEVRF